MRFITRSALLGCLITIPASATEMGAIKDDVHGTATYSAVVLANDFKPISAEMWLSMTCTSDGAVELKVHEGGRIDGYFYGGALKIDYRFDAGTPMSSTFDAMASESGLSALYSDMLRHKRLTLIADGDRESHAFNITDFGAKAGPKSNFGKQCASYLAGRAAPSLETSALSQAPQSAQPAAIVRTHTLPPYPTISMRLGEQGTTVASAMLDATGAPQSVSLVRSSGSARLDQAALDYIKAHWRWEPPSSAGTVVPAEVNWQLPQ